MKTGNYKSGVVCPKGETEQIRAMSYEQLCKEARVSPKVAEKYQVTRANLQDYILEDQPIAVPLHEFLSF